MAHQSFDLAPDGSAIALSSLLPPALRRDLADLNAAYLDLGLTPGLDADPRFAWSEPVRCCLAEIDAETRGRLATVPFALFDLVLPSTPPSASPGRVEDGRLVGVPAGWQGRIESFAHQALFLARRLVEREPLAPRVVLGLQDEVQQWLSDCRFALLAQSAVDPAVIKPRWRGHLRFWEMLVGAVRRNSPAALQWAHCTGLCLIGAGDGEVAARPPPRRPRR